MNYSVFTHPRRHTKIVKYGFNWTAFFFGFMWAAVVRCWPAFFGYFIVYVVGGATIEAVMEVAMEDPNDQETVGLFLATLAFWSVLHITMCCYANDWRRNSLISKGYTEQEPNHGYQQQQPNVVVNNNIVNQQPQQQAHHPIQREPYFVSPVTDEQLDYRLPQRRLQR